MNVLDSNLFLYEPISRSIHAINQAIVSSPSPQVVAKGPGLEKTGVTVNKWAEFTVDTRRAGKTQAPLHVAALDADCNPVEVITKDNKDGTYKCRYMPTKNIKHTVVVAYGGVAVPNSPFRVGSLFTKYRVFSLRWCILGSDWGMLNANLHYRGMFLLSNYQCWVQLYHTIYAN